MIRRIFTASALALALILAPAAALAQAQSVAEPNTITVTPFLSTSFGLGTPPFRDGAIDFGSSLGLGAAVAYDWTRTLGFEAEVGRVFDIAGDDDNLDWSLTTISANVVVHFDAPRVTPYATAGLGWERSNPDFAVVDPAADSLPPPPSATEIAWNFGGGLKTEINDRLLARADLRRFQANDFAPDHWRLYGGLTFWVKR